MWSRIRLLLLFVLFVSLVSGKNEVTTIVPKRPYDSPENYPANHEPIQCNALHMTTVDENKFVYNESSKDCIQGEYYTPRTFFVSYNDCMATCVWRCNNGLQPYVKKNDITGYYVERCTSFGDCLEPLSKYSSYGRSCAQFKKVNAMHGYCCYGPQNWCYRRDVKTDEYNPEHEYSSYKHQCVKTGSKSLYKFATKEDCELGCLTEDVCDSGARPWIANGTVPRYNKDNTKDCKSGGGGDQWYISFKKAKNENDGVCCPGRPQNGYALNYTATTTTPKPTTTEKTTTELITTLESTSTKKPTEPTTESSTESSSSSSTKNPTTSEMDTSIFQRTQSSTVSTTESTSENTTVKTSTESTTQTSTETSTSTLTSTSTTETTQSSTITSTESTSMSTSESSSKPTESSTVSSTEETTLIPVVPPIELPSSTVEAVISPQKNTEKKSSLALIISLIVIAMLLSVLALSLLAYFLHRRNKKAQKREDEIALHRNAVRIAEFQAQERKKAEMKNNEKVPPHKLRGQIVTGLPPPGPVGWEPDQISARKFKHLGPLKWEQRPPVTMVHELENDEPPTLTPDQHIVWDDEQNFVVDIGSEVEEVYRNGQRVVPAKRPTTQPRAQNTPRRSAEGRQLKAIRED
ncbi:hypothetical protein M3Y95_00399800 [Aphelenchoides besseyi]|nr:hypothetical protein M3Y95_00399800 [Aphelenchoides besseyi]